MLKKIKNSCEYVMRNSKHVKINYKKLDCFISSINQNDFKNWLSSNPYNLFDLNISDIINFMLLFESIDYSFWGTPKWTVETELGEKDGSDALLYLMLNYMKKSKKLDFTNISFEEFKKMLKGNIEIPLLEDRYKTLVEISNIVNTKMNGDFYQYIYNIKNDIELFDVIINNFPSFKDERKYNGEIIYFYKLAQLLTSDILHLRENIENVKVDYSHIIGCADYKIPQTMRSLQILEYDDELSEIIDNKKEMQCCSNYETEIRASMLVVINYIKSKIPSINSIDINDYFFIAAKKVKQISKPYHLCRNTNY